MAVIVNLLELDRETEPFAVRLVASKGEAIGAVNRFDHAKLLFEPCTIKLPAVVAKIWVAVVFLM